MQLSLQRDKHCVPEQNLYDPIGSTLYDDFQSPAYELHCEEMPDIISPSFQVSGSTSTQQSQQLLYPHLDCSQMLPPRRSYPFRYQDQARVEDGAAVYNLSELKPSPISQASPGSVSAREPTPFIASQLSNNGNSPTNNTDTQKTTGNMYSPASPRHDFRRLNRHMKPPTLKFINNCQLAVMRLDRFSKHSHSSSSSIKTLHVPSCQITLTPTEFLPNHHLSALVLCLPKTYLGGNHH